MNEVEVEVIVKYNDDADYIRVKNGTYVQDLVRCKNCMHYEKEWCYWRDEHTEPEYFCSYGEREDA